jgi:Na+-transporting methylmalonyl-CoA/oxaloacetate decarboxylase gamma subunit
MITAAKGWAVQILIGLALLIVGLFALVYLVGKIETMIERAEKAAIENRDAHWTAEIERGNAEANRRIADQAKAALAIEADANARIRAVEIENANLEAKNAALPNGDACGLGRDRVRLLSR